MSDRMLLAELTGADPLRRQTALERLTATTDVLDELVIAAVVACLGTPLKAVQRRAADLLSQVEVAARAGVVSQLRTAVVSDDPRLRWGATYALGRLDIVEPAMIAPMVEALGQRDGDQRWAAADFMITCGRVHPELVTARLLEAVVDPEPERRKMALYILRDLAPASPAVHQATIRGLRDSVVGVRFAALSALPRLEPVPSDACALVLALCSDDPDPGLRRAALCTLGGVGCGVSDVDAALAAAATSDDPATRRAAEIARRRLAE